MRQNRRNRLWFAVTSMYTMRGTTLLLRLYLIGRILVIGKIAAT